VLAAKAPSLSEALDKAAEQGLPYLILDGTLISSDRCADKKTSKKGREIDKWYSGKAHEPAGNVQALAAPGGVPLWVSDVLPGSTHDLTAARELVLPQARPYLKDMPILADSGYEGAGADVLTPVKKPRAGELDIDTKTRNALLRSLRYQGERGFAPMSQRWRTMQHVMVSPTTIGDTAKSVLVLVQFEHKMIS
jgi:DDE superfamily endonuclease